MNELLMTYLQNSICNTISSPSRVTLDRGFKTYDSYQRRQIIKHEYLPSSVYPVVLSMESTSTQRISSLSECENEFMQMYKYRLVRKVSATEFIDGESNEAYDLFNEMLEESNRMAIITLQELYWENAKNNDTKTLIKLLNLLASCPFNKAGDVGMCLFITALNNLDIRVKSMALRVASHWACPQLLPYFKTMDFSNYPWLEMKVEIIKRSILRK